MLTKQIFRSSILTIVVSAVLLTYSTDLSAQTPPLADCSGSLCPGLIDDPVGYQMLMSTAYNSEQDYYLITAMSTYVVGLKLTPSGDPIGGRITLTPSTYVYGNSVTYNPDRNEFLLVWRAEPTEIYGRYLDGDGHPLGNIFRLGTGREPRVQYSTVSKRYLTLWSSFADGVHYRMVSGDSTAAQPLLSGDALILSGVYNGRVAYSSGSDKHLIVFVKEYEGNVIGQEVWGRLVSGTGTPLTGVLGIGVGARNQAGPEVGYSSSNDRFLVTYSDYDSPGQYPDIMANLVESNGAVGARFNTTAGFAGSDVTGPISYNEATSKFVASWFEPFCHSRIPSLSMSRAILLSRSFKRLNSASE